VRHVFLDKTGTLTDEHMELLAVEPLGDLEEAACLRVAAALESGSEHPVGRAVRAAARGGPESSESLSVSDFRAVPGVGVEGLIAGEAWALGRPGDASAADEATVIVLSRGERAVARLHLATRLRPGAREVLAQLARRGLATSVLTGDTEGAGRALSAALGVEVEARLLPPDKARRVRAAGSGAMFVGDGLNDAPALAAAAVGVSMSHASSTSLESASVNLLGADLGTLTELVDLSRRAVGTARANLFWAFAYNALGLVLAARGVLTPIFAATAMVVSSLLVVLNSARLRGGTGPAPQPERSACP